ncbi:DNA primase [Aquimarina agarivorans]|uniref:DNA primase n=1 Tax=Aquimarina agarivorans TaxID=980584 RepID=UPI000248E72A|nr:DNA primase [Aquimarina agarivorans]
MIAKETINAVYEAARLEEVIGDYVQLKKAGSNFKGLSPFSDEKSPSFMVSPVKQIWKDFSSGKGGNVIAFLMEHEHYNYPEAIKHLAKRYGIEIQETEQSDEQKQQASERESMYLVSDYANIYFQEQLHKTETGKAIALTYFKERGFTIETIEKFQLGYSPDAWDAFTKTAISKGYLLKYLESTGLSIVKEQKQFDRFKGRVMFPIHSMSGRVLGFGGRLLVNKAKAAKYLNSPESDIYHKSKVLYGIYFAKQAITKKNNCYLVEGYTDVIQFHQTGITNVVSSSGTALTSDQIRLINRLSPNITVLFDGDAAGMRAAIRGIDLILEQGMNVRVCTFPDGEDPDSFAKKHTKESLQAYLNEHQQDFIRFKASLLQEEAANDPIKKAELIRNMVASIAKIPDVIKHEVYVRECASIMQISEGVLFTTLAQLLAAAEKENIKKAKQQAARDVSKLAKAKTPPGVDPNEPPMEVFLNNMESAETQTKVNVLFRLERSIIGILLLYGQEEEVFTELIYQRNEDEELEIVPVEQTKKVYQKIFLDLQMDEIEFTHPSFQKVYGILIESLNSEDQFRIDMFLQMLTPELSSEITDILMEEEKYALDDWERNEIYVKQKKTSIVQYVNDVILNLRRQLVDLKILDLMNGIKNKTPDSKSDIQEDLSEVIEYQNLKRVISEKLNRVI